MWKQDSLMRRCMDVNIVKKIAEYIKVDLSGRFDFGVKSIFFANIIFRNSKFNYYGWCRFPDYYGSCIKCLRPFINSECKLHGSRYIYDSLGNDISNYRNRFEFDDPILEA
jgi:hypothetical protein